MTDLARAFWFLAEGDSSAFSNAGSDNPSAPIAPIRMKSRRETPSQRRARSKLRQISSMLNPPRRIAVVQASRLHRYVSMTKRKLLGVQQRPKEIAPHLFLIGGRQKFLLHFGGFRRRGR